MNDVEKVKQKIDIADLIGEYIPLKKAGQNFKSQCPFHNEKSPSFVVSPERQIWHCFGCGKGGDVFTFLQEFEKIDFPEALKMLADKAHIPLTQTVEKTETQKKRDSIYSLNSLAAQFYNFLLTSHPAGEAAKKYLLEKRKLSPELIHTFNLGFAPSNNALTSYLLKKKKYPVEEVLAAGLVIQKNGRVVDFFRNRVMFPIQDTRGNIIAFSARALSDEDMPKYINTKETIVYKKGDSLFGINFAKDAIKKEKQAILVEGEFDVISSFKEGIRNVVAVKGTALTENQIRLLKRFAEKISFCFDTDQAGTEAQRRSIALIEKEGVTASVIIPPLGKDPDELLNENPLLFKKAIAHDIHIYDFIIDSALKNTDAGTVDGKKIILDKTLPYLSSIQNEVIKEHYLRKLASALSTSYESVAKQIEKLTTPQVAKPVYEAKKSKSREELVENYLMCLILQAKDVQLALKSAHDILQDVPLTTAVLNRLYKALVTYPNFTTVKLFAQSLPQELLETCDTCFLTPLPPFNTDEDYLKEIQHIASQVKILSLKFQLQTITGLIKEKQKSGTEEEVEQLQQEFKSIADQLTEHNSKLAQSTQK